MQNILYGMCLLYSVLHNTVQSAWGAHWIRKRLKWTKFRLEFYPIRLVCISFVPDLLKNSWSYLNFPMWYSRHLRPILIPISPKLLEKYMKISMKLISTTEKVIKDGVKKCVNHREMMWLHVWNLSYDSLICYHMLLLRWFGLCFWPIYLWFSYNDSCHQHTYYSSMMKKFESDYLFGDLLKYSKFDELSEYLQFPFQDNS